MGKKLQAYEGKAITVFFDANRCMHAGKCVHELPDAFKPQSRGRWIFPDAVDADELAAVVAACPSGALTYARGGVEQAGEKPERNVATVMPDGPLYLHAEMEINGKSEPTYRAALCRCGATQKPPYCDGAHSSIGFKDELHRFEGRCDQGLTVDGKLRITAIADGPLLIDGGCDSGCELRDISGRLVACRKELVLCRCGASADKPYCDGNHTAIGFKSE